MIKFSKYHFLLAAGMLATSASVFAGNKDRSGQAGALELNINPWAATNGLFGMNTATVKGLEAMKSNVAGLAQSNGLDIGFAYSAYTQKSGMSIGNAGASFKVGENGGVIGLNAMYMGFGDIEYTSENSPEGGYGTYRPQFFNVSLGYAKNFSKNISAGLMVTGVSEAITNVRAGGFGIDAGIQYVTGKRDNLHFGITLRNWGPSMRFSGDGLTFNGTSAESPDVQLTLARRTEKFDLPTSLNIGVAYDFYLDEAAVADSTKPKHRLTPMAQFTANSFGNDYIGAGVEYAFREMFMLRAAYRYEEGIFDKSKSLTMYNGVSVGCSIAAPLSEDKNAMRIAVDYAFRPTVFNTGVHSVTLRFFH